MSGRRAAPVPCVLGHEGVGHVVDLGPGRADLFVGERVTWTLVDSCGRCAACTEHDLPQKCGTLFKYGHAPMNDGAGLNGCYASHILLRPGTSVFPVPARLPDATVVPANCSLATMVNAVESIPASARSVLVQGAGLLGLHACAPQTVLQLGRRDELGRVRCVPAPSQRQHTDRSGPAAAHKHRNQASCQWPCG